VVLGGDWCGPLSPHSRFPFPRPALVLTHIGVERSPGSGIGHMPMVSLRLCFAVVLGVWRLGR